jgi:hypothetical protein
MGIFVGRHHAAFAQIEIGFIKYLQKTALSDLYIMGQFAA